MINITCTVYIHTFHLHMLLFILFYYICVYRDEIKKSEWLVVLVLISIILLLIHLIMLQGLET